MKDNFFEIAKDIQEDINDHQNGLAKQNTSTSNETESPISTLKMPEFEPGKQYDSEFYNLFI